MRTPFITNSFAIALFSVTMLGGTRASAQAPTPVRPAQAPGTMTAPVPSTLTPPASARPVTVAALVADGYTVNANITNPMDQKQMIVTLQKGGTVFFCQV